jgi:hypothetical protein
MRGKRESGRSLIPNTEFDFFPERPCESARGKKVSEGLREGTGAREELTHAALQALGMVMAVIVAHRQITQIDALKSGTDFAGKVFQKMRSEDRGMMGGGKGVQLPFLNMRMKIFVVRILEEEREKRPASAFDSEREK